MGRSVVQLRIPPAEKEAMSRRAEEAGLSLSEWVRGRCLDSSGPRWAPTEPPTASPPGKKYPCERCARIGVASCWPCERAQREAALAFLLGHTAIFNRVSLTPATTCF